MLETLTMERIMSIKPKPCDCYNPVEKGYMEPDWEGTIIDFLKIEKIPPRDRLWVACYGGFIDDKTLRLFAVWCAQKALKTIKKPDPRSVKACDIAEAYAHGKATEKELEEARNAAWDISNAAWGANYAAYNAAYCVTHKAIYRTGAVYNTAYWVADYATYWTKHNATKMNATNRAIFWKAYVEEHKKQVKKLIDMVENYGR